MDDPYHMDTILFGCFLRDKLMDFAEPVDRIVCSGCQRCAIVDVTLRQNVETTLHERIPELAGVTDVTDHSVRENAYY